MPAQNTPGQIFSANNTTGILVQGSSVNLMHIVLHNTNAAARYVKLYDKATAPTVGTDTPVQTYCIPGGAAGAFIAIPLPETGIHFVKGLGVGITTGAVASDTGAPAANEVSVSYSTQP